MKKLIIALLLVAGLLFSPLAPAADAANYSCWSFFSSGGWKGYGAASFSESGGKLHAHTITTATTGACGTSVNSDLIAYAWIDKWTGSSWVRKATFVDSDHDGAAWAYASTTASSGTYRIAAFHTLFYQGRVYNGWQGYQYYTT